MHNQLETFSKNGFIAVLLFIFFALAFRIFLPLGDEPDYEFRVKELINVKNTFYKYSTIPFFDYFKDKINLSDPMCRTSYLTMTGNQFSLWETIDSKVCMADWSTVIYRTLLTYIVCAPIFLVIIFRKYSYFLLSFLFDLK